MKQSRRLKSILRGLILAGCCITGVLPTFAQTKTPSPLPKTLTVTNLNERGPGSFLQAYLDFLSDPAINMIQFEKGLSGSVKAEFGSSTNTTVEHNLTILAPVYQTITFTEFSLDVSQGAELKVQNINFGRNTSFDNTGTLILNRCVLTDGTRFTNRGAFTMTEGVIQKYSKLTIAGGQTLITGSLFQNGDPGIIGGSGKVTIANSTFIDNSTAVVNFDAEIKLTNTTIYVGYLGRPQLAVFTRKTPVRLSNTIISLDPMYPRSTSRDNNPCPGGIIDDGGNLQFPTGECSATIPIADPKLGPLQLNGGIVPSMALLPGSAAIGRGNPSVCASPEVNYQDQRGFRILDAKTATPCDSGAIQFSAVQP